jgi:hypothetical protein
MEERELTRLLQQLGDRVTPGPPPLRRIVDEGEALRGRRRGRVRMFAVAAAAAAVVGGGSLAATVIDLPSPTTSSEDTAGGGGDNAGSAGGGAESAPEADTGGGGGAGEGATAADAAAAVVVTPDVLRPGETFELTSRDEAAGFGLAWRLERRTPDGWTPAYTLAAAFGEGEPRWWAEGESWVVEEPMVGAPLRFVVPPDAAAGDYRLCEHDAPAVCASLTVTG